MTTIRSLDFFAHVYLQSMEATSPFRIYNTISTIADNSVSLLIGSHITLFLSMNFTSINPVQTHSMVIVVDIVYKGTHDHTVLVLGSM